ncbi:hypothetical protein ACP4OV_007708 [Aristida adscensionis]
MFRLLRPREAHPGGNGAPWASPVRQEAVGLEDPYASRVDGTDFIYDLNSGGIGSGSYFTDLLGGEVQESQEFPSNTESPIDIGSAAVNKGHRSGASVDDKIANACTVFKEEDKKKRKFAFMHCWRILKDNNSKWMDRRNQIRASKTGSNKKPKTKPDSSPSSTAPGLSPMVGGGEEAVAQKTSKRLEGKKSEKKKLRQRSTIEALDYLVVKMKEVDAEKELKKQERCDKAFALQEEKIRLEREKFEFQREQERCNKACALQEEKIRLERGKFDFQREQEEERILSLDLSNVTNRQKQYYEGRQNEILARRGA